MTIHAIGRDEYDRMEAWNFSRLRMLAQSPKHFAHSVKYGSTDSAARKLGRVIHLAVLEPEAFEDRIAVWEQKVAGKKPKKGEPPPPPSDKIAPRNGHAWDEFQAANAGKEIVTIEERNEAIAIANALHEDEHAAPLLSGGQTEVTLSWEFGGFGCKVRLDLHAPGRIVELKKARSVAPRSFQNDAYKYRYHAQAAWQVDAVLIATGETCEHHVIAVEDRPPYVSQVYSYDEQAIAAGRAEYQRWLAILEECQRTKHWRGYADGPLRLSLPAYAPELAEEEEAA